MQNSPIEQDQVNRAVWQACDTFRGVVDASEYKDFVLTMLFLKYISDVWLDHQQRDSVGTKAEEIFCLPQEANFYTLYEQRHQPGNGMRIDRALRLIELSNLDKLADVFQDISFDSNRLVKGHEDKEQTLRHLIEDFAQPGLDLRPSRIGSLDIIGNAYEFLIKNFASSSGKKAGEFYTPPEVSSLIAALVDPRPNESIYDPTCGSGSLLMKCGRYIRQKQQQAGYTLYGQESMASTWSLAKMNMFLHGETRQDIRWGDTLRTPHFVQGVGQLMQFDVVVANPPFSLEKWGYEVAQNDPWQRFTRGLPPEKKGDYAFILHMLASMKPEHGRMAVVVAGGVLFRAHAEGKIRQQLVDENLLDTVIALPPNLFYGTDIAASILLFKHNKTDRHILFIDAGRGFESEKKKNHLRQQDLDKILAACAARRSIDDFAHLASYEEILANQYNLNILRYIPSKINANPVDLLALQKERDTIQKELVLVEEKLVQHLRNIGLCL